MIKFFKRILRGRIKHEKEDLSIDLAYLGRWFIDVKYKNNSDKRVTVSTIVTHYSWYTDALLKTKYSHETKLNQSLSPGQVVEKRIQLRSLRGSIDNISMIDFNGNIYSLSEYAINSINNYFSDLYKEGAFPDEYY